MPMISLDRLKIHPENVRKTNRTEGIEALAENIHANGLIQSLTVVESGGDFLVIAGGRRLAALQLLAKQKKIESNFDVLCHVYDGTGHDLNEISLSENVMRQRMNAADEFESFAKLTSEGEGPAAIGARFGQTARYVEQRLKLSQVSPKLLAIFRKGDMDLDQLECFTLGSSHKQQEKVWRELPEFVRRNGHTEQIRAALTEQHIEADDPLVMFVGLDAYRAAGGNVMQDLFDLDNPEAGYLTDAAILNRLAGEKLEALAEPVKAEGWKWVEINPAFGWQDEQKMGRVNASLTKEQRAEIAQLEKQQEKLVEDEADEHGDLPVKADEKYAELEKQIAAILKESGFTLAQKSNAGVIITVNHNGEAEIKRGLVKPEDKRAAAKAEATDKPAKGKPEAKEGEAEKSEPGMSAALVENLTAHRTAALQAKLAGNPKVGLVAVVHALALSVLDRHGETVVGITGTAPYLEASAGDGIPKTPAAKEFGAATREATKGMPRDSGKLWTWLLQQDQKRLLSILAVAAAHTVDAVEKKFNGADRAHADQLAEALKLDMSFFWQASAEGFFSRVSKEQTLAAVTEAAGAEVAKGMSLMKKAELAVAAEKAVKGKNWVPSILQNG